MRKLQRFIPLLFVVILTAGACAPINRTGPSSGLSKNSREAQSSAAVLVSLDFTQTLAETLLAGTPIKVIRAIPASYPMRGHEAYIRKHCEAFAAASKSAAAVIGLPSAWPGDPLYASVRRFNIRAVPIDAASPMDRSRTGIPLLQNAVGVTLPRIWRSPGNAARMADIAATDLAAVFPSEAEIILGNLRELKHRLFRLRARYENRFALLDAFEIVALTNGFRYLTDEFGIETAAVFSNPTTSWTDEDFSRLRKNLAGGTRPLLCGWDPAPAIRETAESEGAAIIVLKPFRRSGSPNTAAPAPTGLINWYETSLKALESGLSR